MLKNLNILDANGLNLLSKYYSFFKLNLADNPCIYVNKIISEMDELVGIVPEVCHDPTLPRTDDHECPKCRNRRVCFFQGRLDIT